jgi:hypothetical protein
LRDLSCSRNKAKKNCPMLAALFSFLTRRLPPLTIHFIKNAKEVEII